MKINGDLVFPDGGGIQNLTIASSPDLPETTTLGEVHSLYGAPTLPDGFYQHNGNAWNNIPTLDDIHDLIDAHVNNASFPSFKTFLNVRMMVNNLAGGTYWALNGIAPVLTTAGVGSGVLPVFWYDPAIFPVGAKFRLSINAAVNNAATSGTVTATLGLCKVLRPAGSGGVSGAVIYTPDSPATISQGFISLPARSFFNTRTAEFEMPAEAGLYAFYLNLSGTMNASTTHFDISLQAKT